MFNDVKLGLNFTFETKLNWKWGVCITWVQERLMTKLQDPASSPKFHKEPCPLSSHPHYSSLVFGWRRGSGVMLLLTYYALKSSTLKLNVLIFPKSAVFCWSHCCLLITKFPLPSSLRIIIWEGVKLWH